MAGNSSLTVNEVCKILADLSQGMAKDITDYEEHVSKNKKLKSMVDLYFENTNKTLNLFNKFMYTDEFATQYESVYKDHVMLLKNIRELEVVLKKKHKHAKIRRRVAISFLATKFLPVVAVMFLAMSSPALGTAANAGGNSVETLKKLTDMMEKDEYSKGTQIDLSMLIEKGTETNIEAMKAIKLLVVLSHMEDKVFSLPD